MTTDLNNAYFKFNDPRIEMINGVPLHPSWWSRFYEYAFALRFPERNDCAADMGCGWMGRPLTAELARLSKEVYGIDADKRVHGLEKVDGLYYLSMDFTSTEMNYFRSSSFDKIYCISVIEDLSPDDRAQALKNFSRLIAKKGKIIITMDAIWEAFRIAQPYPTVNVQHFIRDVERAGLRFVGEIDTRMPDNAVHQSKWNLACWHCVLERA